MGFQARYLRYFPNKTEPDIPPRETTFPILCPLFFLSIAKADKRSR